MTALTLDAAEPSDEAAIVGLMRAAFTDYAARLGRERPGPYDWVGEAIDDKRIRVLRNGGEVNGAIVATDDPPAATITIDMLAVSPARQGQGIGQAILTHFEAQAAISGRKCIKLHTATMMTHLVAFYSRNGYEVMRVGPQPKGRDRYPRVFMEKALIENPLKVEAK